MEFGGKEVGDLEGKEWKVGNLQSAKQTDGHSCGSFVMLVRCIFSHV